MNKEMFVKFQLYCTTLVFILIWGLLLWNYYHGGVPSHHILADKELPEISNWWGGLSLPLLTWFLFYRMKKRLINNKKQNLEERRIPVYIISGFLSALTFGILLSVFFKLGYSYIPAYMLAGTFVLALFFPIYRSECILGFVLGMAFTFGAVLPMIIGSILALIAAFLHLCIRRILLYVISGFVSK